MKGSRKRTIEKVLPSLDATEALRRLAAGAAEGVLDLDGETIPLAGFASLKVSLKNLGASTMLKIKVKYAGVGAEALPGEAALEAEDTFMEVSGAAAPGEAEEVEVPGGKPRYKGLKKRMKGSFKAVVTALRLGQAPDAGSLASFVADSRLMTSYPGKGDAFYPAFNAEVDRLEAAAATGDLTAMTEAAATLGRMKKECHSRHA